MDKNIKLSFWNYAPFGIISNKEAAKDWAEIGSNLPMSFVYDFKKNKKDEMLVLLNECQKFHLKLIVSDTRTLFTNLRSITKEEYRSLVKAAYDDFGHHEAAFGFFIGDEPSPDESDLFIDAMKIVLEEMPGLVPFGNLLPYFMEINNPRKEEYVEILNKILKETKVPIIGYDQYSQCFDEYAHPEEGIQSYFYGLDKYHEITKQNNASFIISLLSVGHWNYRVPTEDDIRWQIYTALAHGARGITWFYFLQDDHDYSYRNAPYTNFGLKKTPMFDIIARQQYLFKVAYEEQFNKMELMDVYHLNDPLYLGKTPQNDDNFTIKTDRDFPVIVSYYQEMNGDKKYLSFVNGSQRFSNLLRITFKGGKKEDLWLAPGEMKIYDLAEVVK